MWNESDKLLIKRVFHKVILRRQEIIYKFDHILSQIHAAPCPSKLIHKQSWLDQMLIQAEFNLRITK